MAIRFLGLLAGVCFFLWPACLKIAVFVSVCFFFGGEEQRKRSKRVKDP